MSGLRPVVLRHIGQAWTAGLDGRGRVCTLWLTRDHEADTRAILEARHKAIVRTLDPVLGGAFVQLNAGRGPSALLATPQGRPPLRVGERLDVVVRREARGGKAALVALASADAVPVPHTGRPPPATPAQAALIEDWIARIGDTRFALPGGGHVWIEPTRAGIMVDVDSGARDPATARRGGRERAMAALNADALAVTAQVLGVMGLGGRVLIDCPASRGRPARAALLEAARALFAALDPEARVLGFTPGGLLEASVPPRRTPLCERLWGQGHGPDASTRALEAFERLARLGEARRGARLGVWLDPEAHVWAMEHRAVWQDEVTGRIGPRFAVHRGPDGTGCRAEEEAT